MAIQFESDKGIEDIEKGVFARPILWLTVFALIIFTIWASRAPLEEATSGIGKITPSGRAVVIQNLEGGILQSLFVREGEIVDRNQKIAQLDETRFQATFRDLESQSMAIRASLARLNAELRGDAAISFDKELLRHQDHVLMERALFKARTHRVVEAQASFDHRIKLARKQLALIKPLINRQAMSAIEGIRLEKEVSDLVGEKQETRNKYMQEVTSEISKLSAKLESLNQQMSQQRDALNRTTLVSPVRGVVKNLMITTKGGIVGSGETIMEIVPLDDQLLVEAKIDPKDVAFLRIGMPASIKLTAFDYSIYGAIKGELIHISPDTLEDETTRESRPYYLVKVKTVGELPTAFGKDNPIKPGMVASVNILTGTKTVLDYLLKPLTRGREALKER